MVFNLKTRRIIVLFVALASFFLIHAAVSFAKPVSIDTAKQIAERWMLQKTGVSHQVSGEAPSLFGGTEEKGITPYYILNMKSGGWVIVSGDDVAYPIIGYSLKGKADGKNIPPAFKEWMEQVRKEIVAAVEKGLAPLDSTEKAWGKFKNSGKVFEDESSYGAVAPLLRTTWDQGKYYNRKCPYTTDGPDNHAYVGCVATATAQIMKYHNWPTTGTGYHSYTPRTHPGYGTQSANFGATTYYWSSMPGRLTNYNNAVATLLYHVGVSINMNYGGRADNGSSASTSNVPGALRTYFRYKANNMVRRSSYSSSVWASKLRADLYARRPVLYRGSGTGGHCFVCDGYSGTNYFHFNWGWSGSYDNYFYLNDLTPGNYNFNSYQGAVFGIQPNRTTGASAQIISLWSVYNAHCGYHSTLWAKVKNTGYSSLPSTARVWFWVTGPSWSGSHWIGSASVAYLGRGYSKWYSYSWRIPSSARSGTYAYWARVYSGAYALSSWSAGKYFSVNCGGGSLSASVLSLWAPSSVRCYQWFKVWARVKNTASNIDDFPLPFSPIMAIIPSSNVILVFAWLLKLCIFMLSIIMTLHRKTVHILRGIASIKKQCIMGIPIG